MENPFFDYYLNESTKLYGENYVNWKFKLQTGMEGYNIWSIVCEDESNPIGRTTIVTNWE